MDELAALMGELQAVQSAKSSFKLSEPNVVEVVMKLAELGLLEVLSSVPAIKATESRKRIRDSCSRKST